MNRAGFIFWLPALAFTLPCQAFVLKSSESGNPTLWQSSRLPDGIPYYIQDSAYSESNREAELEAVRACFDQWQSVPGSDLKFKFKGLVTSGFDIDLTDGTNGVFWAKTSTLVHGGLTDIRNALGIAPTLEEEDHIIAGDIALNGVDFEWFTDFENPVLDARFIEGTLLHEIGHFIGLSHSPAGGATMLYVSDTGIPVAAGLSMDDQRGMLELYPDNIENSAKGSLTGVVTTQSGIAVFGAVVSIESQQGSLISSLMTSEDGRFNLTGLSPGNYQIWVAPLGPSNLRISLLVPGQINSSFRTANTSFLPIEKQNLEVLPNQITQVNQIVKEGSPVFRINRIQENNQLLNTAAVLKRDQSEMTLGVASKDLDASTEMLLEVSGSDLQILNMRQSKIQSSGVDLLLITADLKRISDQTAPGLRSITLRNGNQLAHAPGYLEIERSAPDYNFDGLDDRFQRRHFERFTSAEAGPTSDPDVDGLPNTDEFTAGTLPTDPDSVLEIIETIYTLDETTIRWIGQPERTYQVFSKNQATGTSWIRIGPKQESTGDEPTLMEFTDSENPPESRFYRVKVSLQSTLPE